MRKRRYTLIALLFFVSLVQTVYAPENEIDITNFDDALGDALGIGAFGGGLLLSFFVLFIVLGCLGAAMRRAPSGLMILIFSMAVLSFCIGAGWFPVWSLVTIIILIALMFGMKVFKRGA